MAALLSDPAVGNSFAHIVPDARNKDIVKHLSENQYALRTFESSPGQYRYGLTQVAAQPNRSFFSSFWSPVRTKKPALPADQQKKRAKATANMRSGRLGNDADIFVDKVKFAPKFLLSMVAIGTSYEWGNLESEVRVMTPYRNLAKKKVDSKHIVDMSLHGVPLTTLPRALWYGNFFHALFAVAAIISQGLVIAVAGVPYNFGVIQDVSLFSSTACIGILGTQILTALAIFWWRKTNPNMPRTPDTLANVIMMLCASKMVQHFDGLGLDMATEKDLMERTEGRQYRLGKQVSHDQKERVMIEVGEVEAESHISVTSRV